MSNRKSSEQYLFETFGHTSFREAQKQIIETLTDQRSDVCAVMATGHGKSICYQLPAIITGHVSIVVSPLLSLMEDQRLNLEKNGVSACCYNSQLSDKSVTQTAILSGQYQIIYVTPEMIVGAQALLLDLHKKVGIGLVAIDEAHCVSLWGSAFRPSYLKLNCLKTWLPQVPMLALTGTATQAVETDIIQLLGLQSPLRIRTGSDRPNLSYYVHLKTDFLSDVMPLLRDTGTGEFVPVIIYCPTRKDTENLAMSLINQGVPAQAYHAGIATDLKEEIHHEFLTGVVTCMVATISFGMGIDKPDIRRVIHYGCPSNMESYLQETGRAGRDGQASHCHVFYNQSDFATNRYFLKDITDPNLRQYKEKMIHAMEQFLYITTCRRAFMLAYFGEQIKVSYDVCCDNCLRQQQGQTLTQVDVGPEVKTLLGLLDDVRQGQLGRGHFGKLMYINVLRGANLKKMPITLSQSQYFGVGKTHSLDWWKTCAQYLINADLIIEKSLSGGYGSVITIGSKGQTWLGQNAHDNPTYVITESDQVKSLSPPLAVVGVIKPRSAIKKIVATTSTSTSPPQTTKTTTSASTSTSPSQTNKTTTSQTATKIPSLTPTVMTTYQLFQIEGKTLHEVAQIRQMSTSTIENHIVECLRARAPLDATKLPLDRSQYDTIMEVINGEIIGGDVSKLAPIKHACSSTTTYYQIKCAIGIDQSGNGDSFAND